MNDKEILNKAIEKARANGWRKYWVIDANKMPPDVVYSLIFSHDFAKAFWGEVDDFEEVRRETTRRLNQVFNGEKVTFEEERRSWHFHLQKMVLEENPISYLEKFL